MNTACVSVMMRLCLPVPVGPCAAVCSSSVVPPFMHAVTPTNLAAALSQQCCYTCSSHPVYHSSPYLLQYLYCCSTPGLMVPPVLDDVPHVEDALHGVRLAGPGGALGRCVGNKSETV